MLFSISFNLDLLFSVKALMRGYNCNFEEAYMFASLVVDFKINQVVDLKRGVMVTIPKEFVSLRDHVADLRTDMLKFQGCSIFDEF